MTEQKQKPIGYAPWHPKHGWRLNLADKDNHTATCNAMRAIESAGSQGWLIKPIYDAALVNVLREVQAVCSREFGGAKEHDALNDIFRIVNFALHDLPVEPQAPAKSVKATATAIGDDALWALAITLHSNVPEDQRPMSWSDFSPEQIVRLRKAAKALLAKLTEEWFKNANLELPHD